MADLSITTANVKPATAGISLEIVTAGATITPGDVLRYDSSTQKYLIADCVVSADTAKADRIALTGGADTEAIAVFPLGAEIVIGATLTQGGIYVLSEDGKISPAGDLTTGDRVVIVGYGKTTTVLKFNPYVTGYVHG